MHLCFLLFLLPTLAQMQHQILRGSRASQAETLFLSKRQTDMDATQDTGRILPIDTDEGMQKMKKGGSMMMIQTRFSLDTTPVGSPPSAQQQPLPPSSTSSHNNDTQSMYLKIFSSLVGSDVYTPGTVYYQAAEWIINVDEQALDINDPALSQRYLLALFYRTTTQNGQPKWWSCNPVGNYEVVNSTHECIYEKLVNCSVNDTFEFKGFPAKRWLSSSPECEWAGVTCDEFNFVTELELFGQNITGTLPTEIAVLPYL